MNYMDYRNMVLENTKDFDIKSAVATINRWLSDYARKNNVRRVVLGISGGKDSTVVAKLLVDALGKESVIGLLMPNGIQKDISDSIRVVEFLGIKNETINIEEAYKATINMIGNVSVEAKINVAPRVRMTTLYTYGQTHGCLVAGTGNLSERTLGYFTKHGDGACDFNLIGNFTSFEVMRIGEEIGLPLDLVYKTPDDGLSGMSDEEKLGISYLDMHKYLRDKKDEIGADVKDKISRMERSSAHKRFMPPMVPFVVLPESEYQLF